VLLVERVEVLFGLPLKVLFGLPISTTQVSGAAAAGCRRGARYQDREHRLRPMFHTRDSARVKASARWT
jgi:hypothetical protein